jgi:hypothetical protein
MFGVATPTKNLKTKFLLVGNTIKACEKTVTHPRNENSLKPGKKVHERRTIQRKHFVDLLTQPVIVEVAGIVNYFDVSRA